MLIWDFLKNQSNIRKHSLSFDEASELFNEMKELTDEDFSRMITRERRRRLIAGDWEAGDVAALRRYLGLTQRQLAKGIGISIATLRNWEQDRRRPRGPARALLRILAKHPRLIRQDLVRAS